MLELAEKASAVALGPGLGRGAGPQELVRRLLAELELPVVVDADALFELEPADWPGPRVLTPHEGELARLLGTTSEEIAAHRLASVREAVERFGCVVVLKGPDTLVAAPGRGLDRLRARAAVARDGGHRRRPHGNRRPRSSRRAWSRSSPPPPRRSRSSARPSRRRSVPGSSQAT